VADYPTRHTEEFWDCLPSCGGQLIADCTCGRTHFAATSQGDYAEGELERLIEDEKANPEKVIGHSNVDMVSTTDLDGITIVWECQCNRAGRYERFVWENRSWILEYLKKRITREAAKNAEQLRNLSEAEAPHA
jgi:hypothetical protein